MTAMPDLSRRIPQLRVRSAADMLAAVPYVLGFHPTDSFVVVAFSGPRLTFSARADLPAAGTPADEIAPLGAQLTGTVRRQGDIDMVVLIAYGPAERVTPLMDVIRPAMEAAGLSVFDALRVTEGRYFSYTCDDPSCCPPEGVPFDVATTTVAAESTFAGVVALPSRDSLAAQVAPVDGEARERMTAAFERVVDALAAGPTDRVPRRGLTLVRRAEHRYAQGQTLTDDELAWLTVAVGYMKVREFALRRCLQHESRLALWSDVTRRTEPSLVAPAATLLAFTAWQQGDGTLANIALDRALAADPQYRLAQLIRAALDGGAPPSVFRDVVTRRPARTR